MSKKPRGKPFPKRCSGNPGGKPKNPKANKQVIADVKEPVAFGGTRGCAPAERCDQIVALERKRQLLIKTAYCDGPREGNIYRRHQMGDDTVKITSMVAAIFAVTGALSAAPAMAWDQDFFGSYFQRSDKITLGAGDAKHVNEATHVIDPWPRYVGQRRIPSNGERMVGAVEHYRNNRAQPVQPPITFPATGSSISGGR